MAVARNPFRYCASSFYDERTGHRIPSFKPECIHCVWKMSINSIWIQNVNSNQARLLMT